MQSCRVDNVDIVDVGNKVANGVIRRGCHSALKEDTASSANGKRTWTMMDMLDLRFRCPRLETSHLGYGRSSLVPTHSSRIPWDDVPEELTRVLGFLLPRFPVKKETTHFHIEL